MNLQYLEFNFLCPFFMPSSSAHSTELFSTYSDIKFKIVKTKIVICVRVESKLSFYRHHKSNFKFLIWNAFQTHYTSSLLVWMFKSGFMLGCPTSGHCHNFPNSCWVPEYNLRRTVEEKEALQGATLRKL